MQNFDHFLAGLVVGLSFCMMVVEESSLFTILPKYFSQQLLNKKENESIASTSNSPKQCFNRDTPYVVVSMIFLAKNLAMIFINPLIGIIIDKVNYFIILILAQILGIGVLLTYSFSNTFLFYVIGRIIDAFVTCIIFVSVYSIISKLFSDSKIRNRYYGFVNTLFSVSHSIGPVYGAKIDDVLGKKAVFIILIPIWVVSSFFTYLLYLRVLKIKIRYNNKLENVRNDLENNNALIEDLNKLNLEEINSQIFSNDILQNRNENSEIKFLKKVTIEFISAFQILKNPFILVCLIQIFVINISMFALPPTLPLWMAIKLCSTEVQQGLIWSFGFIGYMTGVFSIVILDSYFPKYRYLAPLFGQIIIGLLLIILPYFENWKFLFIPIIGMYVSVGVVEQVIIPMTTYIADSQYDSNYGVICSLTSQSLNLSSVFSTILSGYFVDKFGFHSFVISIGVINLIFSPISLTHKKLNPV